MNKEINLESNNIDQIAFSIMQGSFQNIVDEMNTTLFRSALSLVITEGRDIGGAIFDKNGYLVNQGTWDLAVFVGMLEFSCKAILEKFKNNIHPEDIFITNDPFVGGTHFNDVGFIKPIFHENNLEAFTAIVGHWPDIGGAIPGSFAPFAEEYYMEGIRIPLIKIVEKNKIVNSALELILANVRNNIERKGDIEAQISAVKVGEKRFKRLINKLGINIVRFFMFETIKKSESGLKKEILSMKDGVYEFEDFLDVESKNNLNPVRIHLSLKVNKDKVVFDFSKSDRQCASATNGTRSSTSSAVFVITKSLFPKIPMNHGCFTPIEIILPPNSVVNASPPSAVSAMATSVYEKVIGVTLGAFSKVIPDKVMACPYNLINLTIGGVDPLDNNYYVFYLYSEGGFGGRFTKDGNAGLVSLYGGGAKITPVEVFEEKYPLKFEEWTFEIDSGGPGQFRGGYGSKKSFYLTRGKAKLTVLGDRGKFPAWGLFGGKNGSSQRLILNEGAKDEKDLTLRAFGYEIKAGDKVTLYSGGGGGYGNPIDRNAEAVLKDVINGHVSVNNAEKDYGVVIDRDKMKVDLSKTKKLRNKK